MGIHIVILAILTNYLVDSKTCPEILAAIETNVKDFPISDFDGDITFIQYANENETKYKVDEITQYPEFVNQENDEGKEIIIFPADTKDSSIKTSVFVVLRKSPTESGRYFATYAYTRDAQEADNKYFTTTKGRKVCIEWDTYEPREEGSTNFEYSCDSNLIAACDYNNSIIPPKQIENIENTDMESSDQEPNVLRKIVLEQDIVPFKTDTFSEVYKDLDYQYPQHSSLNKEENGKSDLSGRGIMKKDSTIEVNVTITKKKKTVVSQFQDDEEDEEIETSETKVKKNDVNEEFIKLTRTEGSRTMSEYISCKSVNCTGQLTYKKVCNNGVCSMVLVTKDIEMNKIYRMIWVTVRKSSSDGSFVDEKIKKFKEINVFVRSCPSCSTFRQITARDPIIGEILYEKVQDTNNLDVEVGNVQTTKYTELTPDDMVALYKKSCIGNEDCKMVLLLNANNDGAPTEKDGEYTLFLKINIKKSKTDVNGDITTESVTEYKTAPLEYPGPYYTKACNSKSECSWEPILEPKEGSTDYYKLITVRRKIKASQSSQVIKETEILRFEAISANEGIKSYSKLYVKFCYNELNRCVLKPYNSYEAEAVGTKFFRYGVQKRLTKQNGEVKEDIVDYYIPIRIVNKHCNDIDLCKYIPIKSADEFRAAPKNLYYFDTSNDKKTYVEITKSQRLEIYTEVCDIEDNSICGVEPVEDENQVDHLYREVEPNKFSSTLVYRKSCKDSCTMDLLRIINRKTWNNGNEIHLLISKVSKKTTSQGDTLEFMIGDFEPLSPETSLYERICEIVSGENECAFRPFGRHPSFQIYEKTDDSEMPFVPTSLFGKKCLSTDCSFIELTGDPIELAEFPTWYRLEVSKGSKGVVKKTYISISPELMEKLYRKICNKEIGYCNYIPLIAEKENTFYIVTEIPTSEGIKKGYKHIQIYYTKCDDGDKCKMIPFSKTSDPRKKQLFEMKNKTTEVGDNTNKKIVIKISYDPIATDRLAKIYKKLCSKLDPLKCTYVPLMESDIFKIDHGDDDPSKETDKTQDFLPVFVYKRVTIDGESVMDPISSNDDLTGQLYIEIEDSEEKKVKKSYIPLQAEDRDLYHKKICENGKCSYNPLFEHDVRTVRIVTKSSEDLNFDKIKPEQVIKIRILKRICDENKECEFISLSKEEDPREFELYESTVTKTTKPDGTIEITRKFIPVLTELNQFIFKKNCKGNVCSFTQFFPEDEDTIYKINKTSNDENTEQKFEIALVYKKICTNPLRGSTTSKVCNMVKLESTDNPNNFMLFEKINTLDDVVTKKETKKEVFRHYNSILPELDGKKYFKKICSNDKCIMKPIFETERETIYKQRIRVIKEKINGKIKTEFIFEYESILLYIKQCRKSNCQFGVLKPTDNFEQPIYELQVIRDSPKVAKKIYKAIPNEMKSDLFTKDCKGSYCTFIPITETTEMIYKVVVAKRDDDTDGIIKRYVPIRVYKKVCSDDNTRDCKVVLITSAEELPENVYLEITSDSNKDKMMIKKYYLLPQEEIAKLYIKTCSDKNDCFKTVRRDIVYKYVPSLEESSMNDTNKEMEYIPVEIFKSICSDDNECKMERFVPNDDDVRFVQLYELESSSESSKRILKTYKPLVPNDLVNLYIKKCENKVCTLIKILEPEIYMRKVIVRVKELLNGEYEEERREEMKPYFPFIKNNENTGNSMKVLSVNDEVTPSDLFDLEIVQEDDSEKGVLKKYFPMHSDDIERLYKKVCNLSNCTKVPLFPKTFYEWRIVIIKGVTFKEQFPINLYTSTCKNKIIKEKCIKALDKNHVPGSETIYKKKTITKHSSPDEPETIETTYVPVPSSDYSSLHRRICNKNGVCVPKPFTEELNSNLMLFKLIKPVNNDQYKYNPIKIFLKRGEEMERIRVNDWPINFVKEKVYMLIILLRKKEINGVDVEERVNKYIRINLDSARKIFRKVCKVIMSKKICYMEPMIKESNIIYKLEKKKNKLSQYYPVKLYKCKGIQSEDSGCKLQPVHPIRNPIHANSVIYILVQKIKSNTNIIKRLVPASVDDLDRLYTKNPITNKMEKIYIIEKENLFEEIEYEIDDTKKRPVVNFVEIPSDTSIEIELSEIEEITEEPMDIIENIPTEKTKVDSTEVTSMPIFAEIFTEHEETIKTIEEIDGIIIKKSKSKSKKTIVEISEEFEFITEIQEFTTKRSIMEASIISFPLKIVKTSIDIETEFEFVTEQPEIDDKEVVKFLPPQEEINIIHEYIEKNESQPIELITVSPFLSKTTQKPMIVEIDIENESVTENTNKNKQKDDQNIEIIYQHIEKQTITSRPTEVEVDIITIDKKRKTTETPKFIIVKESNSATTEPIIFEEIPIVTTKPMTTVFTTTFELATEQQTTEQSTTEKSATEKIITEQSTTEKPTTEEITTKQTTTELSTTDKLTTEKSTTELLTTELSTTTLVPSIKEQTTSSQDQTTVAEKEQTTTLSLSTLETKQTMIPESTTIKDTKDIEITTEMTDSEEIKIIETDVSFEQPSSKEIISILEKDKKCIEEVNLITKDGMELIITTTTPHRIIKLGVKVNGKLVFDESLPDIEFDDPAEFIIYAPKKSVYQIPAKKPEKIPSKGLNVTFETTTGRVVFRLPKPSKAKRVTHIIFITKEKTVYKFVFPSSNSFKNTIEINEVDKKNRDTMLVPFIFHTAPSNLKIIFVVIPSKNSWTSKIVRDIIFETKNNKNVTVRLDEPKNSLESNIRLRFTRDSGNYIIFEFPGLPYDEKAIFLNYTRKKSIGKEFIIDLTQKEISIKLNNLVYQLPSFSLEPNPGTNQKVKKPSASKTNKEDLLTEEEINETLLEEEIEIKNSIKKKPIKPFVFQVPPDDLFVTLIVQTSIKIRSVRLVKSISLQTPRKNYTFELINIPNSFGPNLRLKFLSETSENIVFEFLGISVTTSPGSKLKIVEYKPKNRQEVLIFDIPENSELEDVSLTLVTDDKEKFIYELPSFSIDKPGTTIITNEYLNSWETNIATLDEKDVSLEETDYIDEENEVELGTNKSSKRVLEELLTLHSTLNQKIFFLTKPISTDEISLNAITTLIYENSSGLKKIYFKDAVKNKKTKTFMIVPYEGGDEEVKYIEFPYDDRKKVFSDDGNTYVQLQIPEEDDSNEDKYIILRIVEKTGNEENIEFVLPDLIDLQNLPIVPITIVDESETTEIIFKVQKNPDIKKSSVIQGLEIISTLYTDKKPVKLTPVDEVGFSTIFKQSDNTGQLKIEFSSSTYSLENSDELITFETTAKGAIRIYSSTNSHIDFILNGLTDYKKRPTKKTVVRTIDNQSIVFYTNRNSVDSKKPNPVSKVVIITEESSNATVIKFNEESIKDRSLRIWALPGDGAVPIPLDFPSDGNHEAFSQSGDQIVFLSVPETPKAKFTLVTYLTNQGKDIPLTLLTTELLDPREPFEKEIKFHSKDNKLVRFIVPNRIEKSNSLPVHEIILELEQGQKTRIKMPRPNPNRGSRNPESLLIEGIPSNSIFNSSVQIELPFYLSNGRYKPLNSKKGVIEVGVTETLFKITFTPSNSKMPKVFEFTQLYDSRKKHRIDTMIKTTSNEKITLTTYKNSETSVLYVDYITFSTKDDESIIVYMPKRKVSDWRNPTPLSIKIFDSYTNELMEEEFEFLGIPYSNSHNKPILFKGGELVIKESKNSQLSFILKKSDKQKITYNVRAKKTLKIGKTKSSYLKTIEEYLEIYEEETFIEEEEITIFSKRFRGTKTFTFQSSPDEELITFIVQERSDILLVKGIMIQKNGKNITLVLEDEQSSNLLNFRLEFRGEGEYKKKVFEFLGLKVRANSIKKLASVFYRLNSISVKFNIPEDKSENDITMDFEIKEKEGKKIQYQYILSNFFLEGADESEISSSSQYTYKKNVTIYEKTSNKKKFKNNRIKYEVTYQTLDSKNMTISTTGEPEDPSITPSEVVELRFMLKNGKEVPIRFLDDPRLKGQSLLLEYKSAGYSFLYEFQGLPVPKTKNKAFKLEYYFPENPSSKLIIDFPAPNDEIRTSIIFILNEDGIDHYFEIPGFIQKGFVPFPKPTPIDVSFQTTDESQNFIFRTVLPPKAANSDALPIYKIRYATFGADGKNISIKLSNANQVSGEGEQKLKWIKLKFNSGEEGDDPMYLEIPGIKYDDKGRKRKISYNSPDGKLVLSIPSAGGKDRNRGIEFKLTAPDSHEMTFTLLGFTQYVEGLVDSNDLGIIEQELSIGRSVNKNKEDSSKKLLFFHPGWKLQYIVGKPFSTLEFDDELFIGLGNCPVSENSKKFELVENLEELIDFYMTVMRINCLDDKKNYILELFKDGYLEQEKKQLRIPTNLQLLKKDKLSAIEGRKLSSAFELDILSSTYVIEVQSQSKYPRSPTGNSISKSMNFLTEMSLNYLAKSLTLSRMHYIRLSRNLVATLKIAFFKLIQDASKLEKCEECIKDKELNLNDRFQAMGLMQFIIHGFRPVIEGFEKEDEAFVKFFNENQNLIESRVKSY